MLDSKNWKARLENDCLFIDDLGQPTRGGSYGTLLQHNARSGIGAYIHPLRLGGVCLTQDSPWHHPHQHGIQTRFVGVNGSDFWHFPLKNGDKGVGKINATLPRVIGTDPIKWAIDAVYQQSDGEHLFLDRQIWSIHHVNDLLLLDLQWCLQAVSKVCLEPYPYGGLYIRMPFCSYFGADVINSAGQRDDDTEQQSAAWVDVTMPLEHRLSNKGEEPIIAGITLLDHPSNVGQPTRWRIDGQRGINPAPSISGPMDLSPGESLSLRYRLVAHIGVLSVDHIADLWRQFSEI